MLYLPCEYDLYNLGESCEDCCDCANPCEEYKEYLVYLAEVEVACDDDPNDYLNYEF